MARFHIRICTAHETALQTYLARNAAQAWEVAFTLAERLLGAAPCRHTISVRPA